MGDIRALRSTLSATDGTAPSIQSSASAMLRLYDKSSSLAVAEWRNVLQTCTDSQLLPLLYVANEVIQISKRNRGNNYLEAFSPVLGGSLRAICERDPSVTEKVRRTAKIWGDRRIFSTRYVGGLIAGVEDYRGGKKPESLPSPNVWDGGEAEEIMDQKAQAPPSSEDEAPSDESIQFDDLPDANEIGDDDDDDPFGNSGPSLLDVSINVNKEAFLEASRSSNGMKRRRSSILQHDYDNDDDEKDGNISKSKKSKKDSIHKKIRRKAALTTSSLVELVDQLSNLDSESKLISRILSSVTSSELYTSTDEVNEVGDELIDLHTKIISMMENVKKQGKKLWEVAEGKRNVEAEFKRYLVWMKAGLSVDEDEIKFCDDLEKKLILLQAVHADAKKARNEKRINEAIKRESAEAAAREKAEKEELKRSLEMIQKQPGLNEVRPGMVWNSQLREYQYLDTEESWRD